MTGTSTRQVSIFRDPYRTPTAAILIIITLIAFEAMAVSAALPTAARELHGLRFYGWAFTGFLLANVVGMVVSGQACDSRGPRPPLAVGMVCFIAGLVVAGTATTMAALVAGRVVQGLGGGLLITAVYVVIGETYPAGLQPKVFTATASAWVVPSLIGPLFSGLLTQHASWRWVFLGIAPFGVLGAVLLAMAVRRLPDRPSEHDSALADPWRIVHALAVAIGVALLETAGQHRGLAAVGLLIVAVLVAGWGLHTLLPPGTALVRPGVAAPVALRGLLAGSFFGIEAVIPLSLSVQHGYGATAAGLPLAGSGIGWALGSWWQGRTRTQGDDTARRVVLMRVGFALVAISAAGVGVAQQAASPAWLVYPAWVLAGFGAGLTMSTTSVLLLRHTTDADRGADSAALQLSDATSGAITTGVAGVLIAAAVRHAISYDTAFAVLAGAMTGVALLGAVVAGRAGAAPSAAQTPRP
ncbi:MFS transporter [Jatrophihabitans sp.]|uniref:MFS transporter n=1 Tax=Jatrophihabitans sp. TaxID=1932789 RepID=UPI0030C6B99B|nr:putative arabinose efflux permease, family [Jatrophihabitans sp.]